MKQKKSVKKLLMIILITLFSLNLLNIILTSPSNDRNWNADQNILAYSNINQNLITIYNIRNFTYENETSFISSYYNKTFNINKIKKVYYIVEPFSSFRGLAHTFLSFEFENNSYISISVEIRKEKGETYSPIKGLFRQYEIMYVIGDENDLIKLRTNIRNDPVFMYPIKTSKEKIQYLFLDMITKSNELKEKPQFYNTITSTCTTAILNHVNKLRENDISYSWKIFFPGYSDEIVFNNNYIETNLNFENAKNYFHINQLAKKYSNYNEFSSGIRNFEENNLIK